VTLAEAAAGVSAGAFGLDSGAWQAWLREQADPAWRPGEWDMASWLFTGDLDNPQTGAWKCLTAACDLTVRSRKGLCRPCAVEHRQSGLGKEEFAAAHVPVRVKPRPASVTAGCIVARDGVSCVRPRHCQGLCSSHYSSWARYRSRMTAENWAAGCARPHTGQLLCLVGGCEGAALNTRGLCGYHWRAWSRDNRRHGISDPRQWAASQPPYLAAHQFSLAPMGELARWELLYGLQRGDEARRVIEPYCMRVIVRRLSGVATLLDGGITQIPLNSSHHNPATKLEHLCWAIGLGFEEFTGVTPADKEVLDLRAAGLKSLSRTGRRRHPGTADLRKIQQPWLRDLVRRWVAAERPRSDTFARTLRAVMLASRALAQRPGGGEDASALQFADMTIVVGAFRAAVKLDGSPYATTFRRALAGRFFALLDFGRRAGLLGELAGSFARDPVSHRIQLEEANEDEIGKAIPEHVIAQLDTHLDALGAGEVYGTRVMAAGDVQVMYQTIYILLRDTGRRPEEIAALPRDCLETDGSEVSLIWNNRKGRRLRRRLPITQATAGAVRAWQDRRGRLDAPARGDAYLFPALTEASGFDHLAASYISEAIRHWADAIPELHGAGAGPDGSRLPFNRSLTFPYAFRHSYAQRHADAGTPIDVLKDLMDHASASTTQGYYKITLKRKRDAVAKLSAHVIDRRGAAAPCSPAAYELRSVAVPYGGCTEPSNVKAGGHACPIRFQCSGCGFYRPDPSYLPAIEQHINDLRADRETATAMNAAGFVTTGMNKEITAYEAVAATMRRNLAGLPAAERAEIEQASAVLRKARLAGGRALLPLTVLTPGGGDQR
jgi:integrase